MQAIDSKCRTGVARQAVFELGRSAENPTVHPSPYTSRVNCYTEVRGCNNRRPLVPVVGKSEGPLLELLHVLTVSSARRRLCWRGLHLNDLSEHRGPFLERRSFLLVITVAVVSESSTRVY